MGLAYDTEPGLIVIEAQAPAESAEEAEATLLEDTDDGPDALRVRLAHQAAAGFRRASPPGGRGRPAAVPAVQPAAGPAPAMSVRGTTATGARPGRESSATS